MTRAVLALNLLYCLLLLAVTLSDVIGPERWLPGMINLYLPQWIWALPAAPLILLSLALAWRQVWIPAAALLWALGPLMGFCWPLRLGYPSGPVHLRIMTYNVKWAARNAGVVRQQIARWRPDILQLQDADYTATAAGPLSGALQGRDVRASGQFVLASRVPVLGTQDEQISWAGSHHHCVRAVVSVNGLNVTLYNVHLLSPRWGLESVRAREPGEMGVNVGDRLQEANHLATLLQAEKGPLILTGDLNSPLQSLNCRALMGAGLTDAFAEAGKGYGYTYGQSTRLHVPFLRIDHILLGPGWSAVRCWVGSPRGSDHSPVIADLVYKP